jgi:hypothetical protein
MPRRPRIITILTIGYVVSPFFILLQGASVHHLPLFGPEGILLRLYITDIAVLLLYPLSAVAIYSVKKWGWYLFIGCALCLVAYNGYVFSLSPRYNVVFLLLFNIAIALVAGIFFRRHIIAPYFNPRLRWWETEPRYSIEVYAELAAEGRRLCVELLDVSTGGCYGSLRARLCPGETFPMTIHCMKRQADVTGKLLRVVPLEDDLVGCGFMFVGKTEQQERALQDILKFLERGGLRNCKREEEPKMSVPGLLHHEHVETASRYLVSHGAHIFVDAVPVPCMVDDLSKNGCFIHTQRALSEGSRCTLLLQCLKTELTVQGVVKRKSELQGLYGYGIAFADLSRPLERELRYLLRILKRIGAVSRLKTASPVSDRVIDEAVRNTPYRTVLFLERMFRSIQR